MGYQHWSYELMERFCRDAFVRFGFTEEEAKIITDVQLLSDLYGVESHGLQRLDRYRKDIERDFAFMSYAPSVFISAKTGQRLDNLFENIVHVANTTTTRITTGLLNDLLATATARVQPPTDKGRRLKIYYMTQASTRPPTFVFFVNRADLFHFSYQRYLENQIREIFGLDGTPIRFIIRERSEKK